MYRNWIGNSFVTSASPAFTLNVTRNGVGRNGTPNGASGSKMSIAEFDGCRQYSSLKYGVVSFASFGTFAFAEQLKAASFFTAAGAQTPALSKPSIKAPVTVTSD